MGSNSRNVRRERNSDTARNGTGTERADANEQNTKDDARDVQRARSGRRNVSNEPLPELSEEGGIEPLQENPADYNDRTRDRELNES